ncbi:unnamed protein product [Brassica rapa]|uniref:Uncharacterized protein n=1 Tax=Brassica campestris TaxID=3711 RepID=A0A8D9M218_BRACM|nr:unnamed protein product [Brassica rapa]
MPSVTYTNRIASKFQFDFSFTQFTNTVEGKRHIFLTSRESINWIHWVFGSGDPNTQRRIIICLILIFLEG